jgi:tyrosyl-tRNA synthetase
MNGIIDCLKERGLIDAITSEALEEHLSTPRKVYCGFDPTADSLHVGNLLMLVILRWFQKYGHTPVVILGGATGRIGDPSGKSSERPLLDEATLVYNVARIRQNVEAVLDFFHPRAPAMILNNDDWFGKMPLIDFLRDVGKHFRVGPMLAKESVRSRIQSEEGISYTEFTYQILQAYDFYYLCRERQVTVQMGGSDQWGNITEGTDLTRRLLGKQVFGLTAPLLTRSDGKKFGKSEQGAIWLSADRCSPYELYQYFFRIPDADVIGLLRKLTFMPLEEISTYEERVQSAPNEAQKRLAEEMVRFLHGEEGVESALKVTQGVAPGLDAVLTREALQALAEELPPVELPLGSVVGRKFVDVALAAGLVSSKSEGARLIQNQGAYLNNEKVIDPQMQIAEKDLIGGVFLLLGSGKKKKILLRAL